MEIGVYDTKRENDRPNLLHRTKNSKSKERKTRKKLEMWANAQRDGRPAEHRCRPLFNAAKFG